MFPSLIFVGNIILSHSLSQTLSSRCSTLSSRNRLCHLIVLQRNLSLSHTVSSHCNTVHFNLSVSHAVSPHCKTLQRLHCRTLYPILSLSSNHLILHPLIVTHCIFSFFALYPHCPVRYPQLFHTLYPLIVPRKSSYCPTRILSLSYKVSLYFHTLY